ncbi:MAG: cytochrome P450 [Polyangiaceae bacterium]|nr:cytochrome P450 [Polyangiaceae bacterium]
MRVPSISGSASLSSEFTSARPSIPTLPVSSWLSGHVRDLSRDKLGLFQRCAEVGGHVRLRLYSVGFHIVTDPELVTQILTVEADAFRKSRALQFSRPTFGNGLVTSEGEAWRQQRRLVSPTMTPKAAASYRGLMESTIAKRLDALQDGDTPELYEEMIEVSLEVACQALFGVGSAMLRPSIRRAATAVQRWHRAVEIRCLPYPHYLPTLANLRSRSANWALDRAVFALIREERKQGRNDRGLLSAMLQARDARGRALMTDRQIRDQVVTLFLAGHDTTATSMAFALYELSYRPDLQSMIRSELAASGASETLDRSLKETLRLYPAVHMIARMAVRDVMLGRHLVRKGDELLVPLWVFHRDPKVFPDPEAFCPERWGVSGGLNSRARAYLPFSTGPRVCTGQSLAQEELKVVVAAVLRKFQLEAVEPRKIEVQPQLTIVPKPGTTIVRIRALRGDDS